MIDSPSLQQLEAEWSVGTPAHAGGHPEMIDSQTGQWSAQILLIINEDPLLHMDATGSAFLHSYITEDPPFCTCYEQQDPKSCNVIGHC